MGAEAKEGEGMTFNCEIGLLSDCCKLIFGQANLDLDDAVTMSAGQVVVMAASTNAVVVRTIGKFNTV